MFFGQIIDQPVIFIVGASDSQIMYEKKGIATSFFLISDFAEPPFIIKILRSSEQIFDSA
jgi:hypothetical protein